MIFYLGHKVEGKVDDKVRIARNAKKAWEYGFNEQLDTVIISRDGTLGEIYCVCGLNIGFPQKPEHRQIKNWDKAASYQKWEREAMPAGLNSKTQLQSKFEEYIESQFYKRENGTWIYLNGKTVYLTGIYWFFLQWIRIEENYPDLRIIQNELMIFWEACKADKRCLGMIYCKNRRIGASSLAVVEQIESGTIFENKNLGIISKTGEDAKDIFDRVVTAFKRLPCFFKPETDGNKTPQKVLYFREQNGKRTKDEEIDDSNEGNNTSIKWYATAKNAMDGLRMFRTLLDESAKWLEVKFDKYWSKVKTSHIKGRIIFGKSMVVSTINPMDEGGQEFKNVYDKSDVNDRNSNDQTKSGLYKIFIPARFCMEGFFDVYGFSIVDDPNGKVITDAGDEVSIGSRTHLQNILDSLKGDPDEYNEQLRQFPDREEDAFRPSAQDCVFNILNILDQEAHNRVELEDKFDSSKTFLGNNHVERGNFAWKDGIQDTEVIWRPDPHKGRFYIDKRYHPPVSERNRKVKKQNRFDGMLSWAPATENVGCLGVDPYTVSKAADGRGSKGAIHLVTGYNTGPYPNNACLLEYIDRPDRINTFYEDVIMACVYYGMPMLPELSIGRFSTYIYDRGYRNFVLNNPFKTWNELNPEEKEFGGIPAQNLKVGEQQEYVMETYIEDYIGISQDDSNRQKGLIGNFPFTRTLMQLKDFDPKNRTKFDACISFSLAILGNGKRIKYREAVKEPTPFRNPFKTYDNSGTVSIVRN